MKDNSSVSFEAEAAVWIARRDAGLTPQEQQELQEWLASDPRRRAAFARYELSWAALDRPYRAGAGEALLQEIGTRVRRRGQRKIALIAAAAICLLTVSSVWHGRRSAQTKAPAVISADAVVIAPERRVLPDGSVVEIRAGADLEVAFTPGVRRVHLRRGQAHFQVTKDPARPFIVQTDSVSARAVGTAFSVDVRDSEVAVLVTEGSVAVDVGEAPDLPAPASPSSHGLSPGPLPGRNTVAIVLAGSQIAVPRPLPAGPLRVKPQPVSATELDELLAWRATRVEFSGASLAEAVDFLNRAAGGPAHPRFVIADRSLEHLRVSGLFRLDQATAFVQLLHYGFGVEAEQADDGRILLHRKKSGE